MIPLGWRRAGFCVLVIAVTLGFVALSLQVLSGGGWGAAEVLIVLCFGANAPWLALYAATGLVGLAIRLTARDPAAAVLPALATPASEISGSTVVAVCVRDECMRAVLPPLERLLRDLRAAGGGDRFKLAVLSDTQSGHAAALEAAAAAELAARLPEGAMIYRRRPRNIGFKAGNLMDFLDGAGRDFTFCLVLDADSVMSAGAVLRLARVMSADPGLAILQPTVAGRGADTSFARLFGLGHRQGVRIWATGQAWWQGPEGPYWGHNALIRVAAFRAHARLPELPGGGHILSHDHVEAALLHGAGWAVCVLPEDAGSNERHPPDLPAMFARDLRWAAGNVQYLRLLRMRSLGRLGRFQMLQAALHYMLTPLWFAILPLAALNVATDGAEGTPRGALLLLLALGFVALHLPKLAGYAELFLRGRDRPPITNVLREIAFGLLLDPIAAFDRVATLARLAFGRHRDWGTQRRDGRGLSWRDGLRRFGAHTAAGLIMLALFASGGVFPALVALPALAGLLLAVPLAVLTARPDVTSSTAAAPAAGAARQPSPAPRASRASAPAERRI